MPLDFNGDDWPARAPAHHVTRGLRNHLSGLAAEDSVARYYLARGYRILARRWRGQAGEIDLIAAKGEDLVMVEVKRSRSFEQAAAALRPAQLRRLLTAAEDYIFGTHLAGRFPLPQIDCRFDLALVDGQGAVEICEAAIYS